MTKAITKNEQQMLASGSSYFLVSILVVYPANTQVAASNAACQLWSTRNMASKFFKQELMKKRLLLTALIVLSTAPLSAETRVRTASITYPKEIRGVWELSHLGPCKSPLEQDTQSAIEIEAGLLHEYEEQIRPVGINKLATFRAAWAVRFRSDADEYQSTDRAIFVLNERDQLTIVNDRRTNVYVRCE